MRFNTLLLILAVIALVYRLVAVFAPGFLINLIWPNPTGPESHLLIQEWGACLIAFDVMAWEARSLTDSDVAVFSKRSVSQ